MKFLVDTNVWLELLLDQEKAGEAKQFLQEVDSEHLAITTFSLFSIGIILYRYHKFDVWKEFVAETMIEAEITELTLENEAISLMADNYQKFHLDFDDGYQYQAIKSFQCELVSFDTDFDRTDIKRLTPIAALRHYQSKI